MKCPNDGATLTMSERSGVEIDYCPECRGVWLDRGELDKILERVAAELPAAAAPPPPGNDQRGYDQRGYDQRGYDQRGYDQPGYDQPRGYQQSGHHSGGYQQGYKKKRKENWLSELFD